MRLVNIVMGELVEGRSGGAADAHPLFPLRERVGGCAAAAGGESAGGEAARAFFLRGGGGDASPLGPPSFSFSVASQPRFIAAYEIVFRLSEDSNSLQLHLHLYRR